jgi:hypothetical protein
MIIDGLPGGGAEKTVLTLSRGLIEMGHQVSLFSLRKVCDYAIPEGIDYQVVQDTCKKPWRKLTEIPRRAQLLDQAIERAERSGKFDVVFSHLHKTDRIVAHCRALERDKVWFVHACSLPSSSQRHRAGLNILKSSYLRKPQRCRRLRRRVERSFRDAGAQSSTQSGYP